jgi:hypothetical protein
MILPEWKYQRALLEERERIAREGTLRERIMFDLEGRSAYAWGLLTACDLAKFFNTDGITAIEFGVAEGAGLIELSRLAELIAAETGVSINVAGFDMATGLPPPTGYRDHPELWSAGDFGMGDPEALRRQLPPTTELIIGDVWNTVPKFIETLDAPIGFCSFDVDTWMSTVGALKIYNCASAKLLPVGVAYFDDTIGGIGSFGGLCRNKKSGQLKAIDSFNVQYETRVIDTIRTLRYRRPLSQEPWLEQVYGVHALDHPMRNEPRRSTGLSMSEHGSLELFRWRY